MVNPFRVWNMHTKTLRAISRLSTFLCMSGVFSFKKKNSQTKAENMFVSKLLCKKIIKKKVQNLLSSTVPNVCRKDDLRQGIKLTATRCSHIMYHNFFPLC